MSLYALWEGTWREPPGFYSPTADRVWRVDGGGGLSAGMHMKQIKGMKAISGQLGTHGIMEDVRDQHKCLQPSPKTLNK